MEKNGGIADDSPRHNLLPHDEEVSREDAPVTLTRSHGSPEPQATEASPPSNREEHRIDLVKPRQTEQKRWLRVIGSIDVKEYRRVVHQFLDDPSSSNAALICCAVMVTLIVLSVIVLVLRETPNVDGPVSSRVLNRMEITFNIIFTAEILLRLSIAESAWRAWDFYITFDVLSVAPFWIGIGLKYKCVSSGQLRLRCRKRRSRTLGGFKKTREMFKALRMLRLLKLTRRYDGSIVIVQALRDSAAALSAPLFFLCVAVVMGGVLLYVIEEDRPSEAKAREKPQHFQSVIHAIWFMVVTFLTVGFGDTYPMTIQGKLLTSIAMFIGIFDCAMIYAIVGNNFCRVWDEKDKVIFVEKLKEHFHHLSIKREDVQQSFRELDLDGSGTLDFDEFSTALEKMQIKLTKRRVVALWNAIDYDQKNFIRLEEFVNIVYKDEGGTERMILNEMIREEGEGGGDYGSVHAAQLLHRGSFLVKSIGANIHKTLNKSQRLIHPSRKSGGSTRSAAAVVPVKQNFANDGPYRVVGEERKLYAHATSVNVFLDSPSSSVDTEDKDDTFSNEPTTPPPITTGRQELPSSALLRMGHGQECLESLTATSVADLAAMVNNEVGAIVREQRHLAKSHNDLSACLFTTLHAARAYTGERTSPCLVDDDEIVALSTPPPAYEAKKALQHAASRILVHATALKREDVSRDILRVITFLDTIRGT